MNLKVPLLVLAGIITAGVCLADTNGVKSRIGEVAGAATCDDQAGRAMLQAAQRIIAAYHAGQPKTRGALRVVYFVPKDCTPLPDYEARLDRVVSDVNAFYRDGLRRFGIETGGLPLEREHAKLVVHLVRGKLPASDYNYESGDRTAQEIRLALQDKMDVEREHLLVFYALCRREADGRYVFTAPYYGGG